MTAKDLSEVYPDYEAAMDVRFMGPIHTCPCGSMLFNVKCSFDDYEISMYMTDAECTLCGTKVKVPTPADKPGDGSNVTV
jgi:hypothetical protein